MLVLHPFSFQYFLIPLFFSLLWQNQKSLAHDFTEGVCGIFNVCVKKMILLTLQRLLCCPSFPHIYIPRIQRTNECGITSDQNDTALMTYCSKKFSKTLKEGIVEKMLKRRAWYKQKLGTTEVNGDVWPQTACFCRCLHLQQHRYIYNLVLVSLWIAEIHISCLQLYWGIETTYSLRGI